jgi:hypothetical protein
MSRPNSASGRSVQKQQLNVFTVMLIVAFVAITIASLLLYLELRRWGSFPWWKPPQAGATTSYLYQVPGEVDAVRPLGRSTTMWS